MFIYLFNNNIFIYRWNYKFTNKLLIDVIINDSLLVECIIFIVMTYTRSSNDLLCNLTFHSYILDYNPLYMLYNWLSPIGF